MATNDRRCPHARSSSGKPKMIFDTEDLARQYGEEHPEREGQNAYFCARGTTAHWHLTRAEHPEIPGLKRGKFGRRGGNPGHERGLTRRPRNG